MVANKASICAFCILLATAAALVLLLPAVAAERAGDPEAGPPSIPAVKVTEPPAIDGLLDDACWQQATHVEGFWRDEVDAPELQRTEAWLCYDQRAIYVAFRCHDSTPDDIRCDQKKRQGNLYGDDCVEFWLDVENSGYNFYSFRVNAAGTQCDRVPGGTSEKIEWKGDWRAAATIDEGGWNAEIEVPFSILRYPQGQDAFRLDLVRRLAREEHRVLWPPCFARVFDMDNCARWTGIETPPVPFRYVLMPYALAVASEHEEDRENITGGLDFKGTLPNGVVTLATYNPDFRNIEDVVETIDFTYVERYLPEYRPFFQEGGWHFPSSQIFYSRRIDELDWGAKAFGTVGPHRFGVLDAYRRGGENHLACEYDYLFGTQGAVWLSAVDRRVPGEPDNSALGLASSWSFPFPGGSQSFSGDWFQSRTEGEGGDDGALTLRADVVRRQGFSWYSEYASIQPEFRADDGYVPETGVRKFYVNTEYSRTYDEGPLQRSWWTLWAEGGMSQDGSRRSGWLGHQRDWRNGWSMWVGASGGERDGFDEAQHYIAARWNRQDMRRTGRIDFHWGERYSQPYRYQRLVQAFRPSQRWSAELRAERVYAADLDYDGNIVPPDYFRQLVLTTTYDITDEKTVSARLVRRGSTTNAYAAYRQRVRSGMDLLVLVGDPNADKWVSRLAVKAIWCL